MFLVHTLVVVEIWDILLCSLLKEVTEKIKFLTDSVFLLAVTVLKTKAGILISLNQQTNDSK